MKIFISVNNHYISHFTILSNRKKGMNDNERTMEVKRQIRKMGCDAMGVAYNEKGEYQCLVDLGRGKVLATYIQSCSTGGVYNNNPELPMTNVSRAVEIIITQKLDKGAPSLSAAESQKIIAHYKDLVFKSFWTGKAFETPYGTGKAYVLDLSLSSLLRAK